MDKDYSLEELKAELISNISINGNTTKNIPPKPSQQSQNINNSKTGDSSPANNPETKINSTGVIKDEINVNETQVETNNNTSLLEQNNEGPIVTEYQYETLDVENITPSKKKKNKKDNKYKNSYIYGFIFIIFSIILEVANHVRLGLGLLPTNFGIEFSIILILAGLIFLIPTEPAKVILMSLFLGVQFIMNIANASLYNMTYDFITIDMIFTLGFETMDAFSFNEIDATMLIVCAVILVILIITIILTKKLAPKFKLKKNRKSIFALIILLVSIEFLGFGSYSVFKTVYFNNNAQYLIEDNEYLYTTQNVKFASLKKYGFWSFYINNASNFLMYNKTISEDKYKSLSEYLNNNENFNYSGSTYNSNNVSGSLTGDNLIMIMLESAEWFAIDPYNTPVLYSFINNESLKFTNFHSKNKTNINEEISLLGGVPNNYSLTTINKNVGINVPNSLPNLLKNSGIQTTNFFHGYNGKIYDRNVINKELGFDDIITIEDSSLTNKSNSFGDFVDDGEFLKACAQDFMPTNKSFFSYFTTVTTHGPYDKTNSRYSDYYKKFDANYLNFVNYVKNNNLNYLTPDKNSNEYQILKEYKSRAMAIENAFVVMLDYLKNNSDFNGTRLFDNTTIVLFADHNAYYQNLSYVIKDSNKFANSSESHNVPFAIFNKDLPSGEVNAFCSTYDIYPTICDLYGLSFNKGLVQGNSVFSNDIEKSVFVSYMSGMFDDNFYTTTLDDFRSQDNSIQTNTKLSQFKQKLNIFLNKQKYIEQYYQINFENYVVK